jgi:hypothetical protein
MRYLPLILLLFGPVVASEPAYPLWDGQESVADYAKKVNLPSTKTLDLGGGVKMELVLIPAGKLMQSASVSPFCPSRNLCFEIYPAERREAEAILTLRLVLRNPVSRPRCATYRV